MPGDILVTTNLESNKSRSVSLEAKQTSASLKNSNTDDLSSPADIPRAKLLKIEEMGDSDTVQ